MKAVLPGSWSSEVNAAAFDILLGRYDNQTDLDSFTAVVCPAIMPVILAALQNGLTLISGRAHVTEEDGGKHSSPSLAWTPC